MIGVSPAGMSELRPEIHPQDPQAVKKAAGQFEALLIGQLIKSMREAGGGAGWLGSGEDQAGSSMVDFAEQQFAQVLAARGGLGLGSLVMQGLNAAPKEAK
ncbi:MAG TPA: hypothetical protein DEH78_16035 [Solibacterales bacterium]|nr:hypothetical protein [Bryobacterales bacterium]